MSAPEPEGRPAGALRVTGDPEVALAGEQLSERVADVEGLDVGGLDARVRERAIDHLADEIRDLQLLAREVAGEVALDAAEDEHAGQYSCVITQDLA